MYRSAGTVLSCSTASASGGSSSGIVIGTTDKVTFLDPAGSFDNGSLTVQTQVFATLMNSKPGTADDGKTPARREQVSQVGLEDRVLGQVVDDIQ